MSDRTTIILHLIASEIHVTTKGGWNSTVSVPLWLPCRLLSHSLTVHAVATDATAPHPMKREGKNNRPLCSGANPKLLFGTWLLRSKEGNHFSALICPPVSALVITYAPWQRRHGRGLNAVRGWPRKKLKGFPEMEKFHYHRLLGLHWFQIFRSVRGVLLPVVPNNRSESVVLFPALAPHAIEFK